MGVCGLVESPLLTICSAEMRSFLERLMFMVVPFRGFSRGGSPVFLWQRVVNKYSSGSSRCCGFVEKWKKCRSDAGVAVDKLGRVMRKLSTVYTDEEWMSDYPQYVHKNCGGLCTEICTVAAGGFCSAALLWSDPLDLDGERLDQCLGGGIVRREVLDLLVRVDDGRVVAAEEAADGRP